MLSRSSHPCLYPLFRLRKIGGRLRTRHSLIIAFAGVVLLSLLGCEQQDAIETHLEPRPEAKPDKVRLLGAIIRHGKETWFLKLVGPLDAIDKRKDEFNAFVRSVKFTNDAGSPITWEAPKYWEKQAGNEFRVATIRVGGKDSPLEVSVSKLGDEGEAASVLANVNRWRRLDLGLKPVFIDDIPDVTQDVQIAGGEVAAVVDMKGPGSDRPSKGPPMVAGRKPGGHPAIGKSPLSYTTPSGWEPVKSKTALVEFRVKDGDEVARVTIMELFGPAGGLLKNVNRWRTEQLGLKAWEEDQVRDNVKKIPTADGEADFVNLLGISPEDHRPARIMVAIVPHAGSTWFIKMMGPPDLVAGQEAVFKQFVKSVTFDGGNGG
jgi:hypothetical protein